jgi:superfamily I DNA/RNA helicase
LANKIRYEFDRNEENINVTTFHSLARAIITEFEPDWWDENAEKDEEFWNLEVPVKLQDFISYKKEEYDVLIIDEGQDFKDFWYELVFQLVKPDGNQLIFLDPMQNVFGHYTQIPNESSFFKWPLTENCRNTKNIVSKLSDATGRKIECFKDSPEGEEVVEQTFKNNIEQQTFLVSEIKSLIREQNIDPSQILIMLNSSKADSCIVEVQKIANLPLHSVDNKGRLLSDAINYTNINTFKGLEADIVFVVDIQLIPTENKLEKLYTESSRARHKLYLIKMF